MSATKSTILVTGASRGIGLGFVRYLLHRGNCNVIAAVRSPSTANELLELSKEFQTLVVSADSDASSVESKELPQLLVIPMETDKTESVYKAAAIVAKFTSKLDVLINNAGIATKNHPNERFLGVNPDEFLHIYDVNVGGYLRCIQSFYSLLQKGSSPKVVNIGSSLGSISGAMNANNPSYRCSKTALNMLTKCAAIDLSDVIVVCIEPGWVQTDMGNKGNRTADLTVDQSVPAMLKTIDALKAADSGNFLTPEGEIRPY